MTIYLASDHAGFELKEKVKKFLGTAGYQTDDCGAFKLDENDDYPDFIKKAAEAVSKNPNENLAIVFGGSGQGEAMVANRYQGVRAAVYYGSSGILHTNGDAIIRLSREHNDANVLSLGARFVGEKEALRVVALWLKTPFSKKERHQRRIDKF